MDVKKIGRIPGGGGRRAHGREMGSTSQRKKSKIGFDYVHSVVDDHSRVAYAEIHTDERADATAEFFARVIEFFASHDIAIERLMTDNAWRYGHGRRLRELLELHGIAHKFIRRTAIGRTAKSSASTAPSPPTGPTDKCSPATTNAPPRLHHGSATTTLNGTPPSRPPTHQPTHVTNLMAGYSALDPQPALTTCSDVTRIGHVRALAQLVVLLVPVALLPGPQPRPLPLQPPHGCLLPEEEMSNLPLVLIWR